MNAMNQGAAPIGGMKDVGVLESRCFWSLKWSSLLPQHVSDGEILRLTPHSLVWGKNKQQNKKQKKGNNTMAIRKRASAMTVAEQNRFKAVITQLINALGDPNPYGTLVGRHANHAHNMHPFMGAVATQRFLPWHRVYVLKIEQMGQAIDPLFFIPYWKWTTQRAVPPWLATFKPTVKVPGINRTVTRNPPRPGTTLPTSAQITAVLALGTFTNFVNGLDAPHGRVHNWCFGTMSDISWSPVDPLFWLHHAEIDRIWSQWQATHPGLNPSLTGTARTMDPWPETESQVRSIAALGYSYGP